MSSMALIVKIKINLHEDQMMPQLPHEQAQHLHLGVFQLGRRQSRFSLGALDRWRWK
jgi:hypothetical protein